MKKEDKQQVVSELTERLRNAETVIVADYRGLTMPQIDELRSRLLENGARFSVVKNTLGRRAAQEAGNEALLALLEGPTAIAFLESGGDPVAIAKAFRDAARDTRILAVRGGVLEGRAITAEDVEGLATLPPLDVLRGQVLGAIIGPLNAIMGLVSAPLQSLHGLIDARIEQLEAQGDTSGAQAAAADPQPEPEATPEPEAAADPAEADETTPTEPAETTEE